MTIFVTNSPQPLSICSKTSHKMICMFIAQVQVTKMHFRVILNRPRKNKIKRWQPVFRMLLVRTKFKWIKKQQPDRLLVNNVACSFFWLSFLVFHAFSSFCGDTATERADDENPVFPMFRVSWVFFCCLCLTIHVRISIKHSKLNQARERMQQVNLIRTDENALFHHFSLSLSLSFDMY